MTEKSRKVRGRLARRRQIVDAAERVFFSHGFDDATMDDVANEAGLSKGSLYLYFKNKEDLYFAIAHVGLSMIHERFESVLAESSKGVTAFSDMLRAYLDFWHSAPHYVDAVLYFENALHELADAVPNLVACRELCRTILGTIRDTARAGMKDGSIRADIDVNEIVVMFWSQATGMISLARQPKDVMMARFGVTVEHSIDTITDCMIRALAPMEPANA